MKEVKVLSEEKLNFLKEHTLQVANTYLRIEEGLQSEISLEDGLCFAEEIYKLLNDTNALETYNTHLEKENKLLRDILIQKDLELYKLKCD